MRARWQLLVLLFAGSTALGCHDVAAPLPQSTWHSPFVPSGGYIQLSLSTAGSQVSGSGSEYGLQTQLEGQVSIHGTWISNHLSLTITPQSGTVQPATYSAAVVGDSLLQGTWSEAGHSGSLTFYRQ